MSAIDEAPAGKVQCPQCHRWLKLDSRGCIRAHYADPDGPRVPWPDYCSGMAEYNRAEKAKRTGARP